MMRFYQQARDELPHRLYGGVDLHARSRYLYILDQAGAIRLHENVAADPAALRQAIAPYRDGLVVACECMFDWYWLANLCRDESIPFVLAHHLYMEENQRDSVNCSRVECDATHVFVNQQSKDC
jgi:hypothetical protein